MDKPSGIEKYRKWIEEKDPLCRGTQLERYYDSVMVSAREKFRTSGFWQTIQTNWATVGTGYYARTAYHLFAEKTEEIHIKPFSSMFDKTFRKNVLLNSKWPNPPAANGDWVLPSKCFDNINDLLRTTVIVKYLDGAEYFLEQLQALASTNGLLLSHDFEAKDEGCYAIHAYLKIPLEIPDIKWDTRTVEFSVEIQITTQIQDTIRKLTHEYYEQRRSLEQDKSKKWQWNYKSDSFTANYLGHILHYLEGMIMEIRDKKEEK